MKKEKFQKNYSPTVVFSAFLIILTGFLSYHNALTGQFVWDDETLVVDNPMIKDWANVIKIFKEDIGSGAGEKMGFYRPLQMLSYLMDYSISGPSVIGFHLTNIVLHVLVALSLYALIWLLFKNQWIALWTSLLFVAHPVQVAAVTYISGRADSLSALFLLTGLSSYVLSLRAGKIIWTIVYLLCFLAALLSKESSVIFPLLLWLYHFIFQEKTLAKKIFPIFGIIVLYIIGRIMFMDPLVVPPAYYSTLLKKFPGFFVAISEYCRVLSSPVNLHMEYGNPLFTMGEPKALWGLFISLGSMILALTVKKGNRIVSFAILWFFLALLPVSLFPINAYMAEHWLYLPSMGYFLLLASGLEKIRERSHTKSLTVILGVMLVAGYSFQTYQENFYWEDSVALYRKTLRYAPRSVKTYYNLGKTFQRLGKNPEAISCYKRVIELSPNDFDAYYNLETIYRLVGQMEEVIQLYEGALQENSHFLGAYVNLGKLYSERGDLNKATDYFKKAIEIDSENPKAYYNLCVVYYEQAHFNLAEDYCQEASRLGITNESLMVEIKRHLQ